MAAYFSTARAIQAVHTSFRTALALVPTNVFIFSVCFSDLQEQFSVASGLRRWRQGSSPKGQQVAEENDRLSILRIQDLHAPAFRVPTGKLHGDEPPPTGEAPPVPFGFVLLAALSNSLRAFMRQPSPWKLNVSSSNLVQPIRGSAFDRAASIPKPPRFQKMNSITVSGPAGWGSDSPVTIESRQKGCEKVVPKVGARRREWAGMFQSQAGKVYCLHTCRRNKATPPEDVDVPSELGPSDQPAISPRLHGVI